MAEFKVTRDMAEELSDSGKYQLPPEFTPSGSYIERIKSLLAQDPKKLALPPVPKQVYKHYNFWPVVSEFARIGMGSSIRNVQFEAVTRKGRGIHRDRFYQNLSLIYMEEPNSEDWLWVAGRGAFMSMEPSRLGYISGPILLAGGKYGQSLGSDPAQSGYTWHRGEGELGSQVLAFDFFC